MRQGLQVDDHICVVVRSKSNEPADEFKKRLIAFWSTVIRARPDDYKRVYAESAKPEAEGLVLVRKYLVEAEVADILEMELTNSGLEYHPIDRDDLYSKYEAAQPEWFQIPH